MLSLLKLAFGIITIRNCGLKGAISVKLVEELHLMAECGEHYALTCCSAHLLPSNAGFTLPLRSPTLTIRALLRLQLVLDNVKMCYGVFELS